MASPQIENGYTKIANEILEQVYKTNLSAYESRVLWFVIRKTYGWDKRTDRLSVSQIADGTDLDRGNAGKALRKLKSRNMILTEGDQIGFQKDHEKWGCVSTDTGGVSLQTPVSRSTSKGVSLQTPQHKEEKKEEIPPSSKAHPVQLPSPPRKKKQSAPDSAQLAAFDVWYSSYPLHRGRTPARKAWLKLNPDEALTAAITKQTEAYSIEVDGREPKYILYPTTWLNARPWDDEPAAGNGNGHEPPKVVETDDRGNYVLEDGSHVPPSSYERTYGIRPE